MLALHEHYTRKRYTTGITSHCGKLSRNPSLLLQTSRFEIQILISCRFQMQAKVAAHDLMVLCRGLVKSVESVQFVARQSILIKIA